MAKSDANLLTQAGYARSRKERRLPGGSREAVRKAIERGHISAFGPDKLLDGPLADAQWERNTRARISPAAGPNAGSLPRPTAAPADGDGTLDLSIDPAGNPAVTPKPVATDPGYSQYAHLRARREEADAQIAEMNAAKMKGTMLMRQDVDRAMFEIGREIRDRLTACARRIAAEVASINTAEGCESVVDREHRIVLELLASTFREKIGTRANEAA